MRKLSREAEPGAVCGLSRQSTFREQAHLLGTGYYGSSILLTSGYTPSPLVSVYVPADAIIFRPPRLRSLPAQLGCAPGYYHQPRAVGEHHEPVGPPN
jgi:hypothetical protein